MISQKSSKLSLPSKNQAILRILNASHPQHMYGGGPPNLSHPEHRQKVAVFTQLQA